jgi:pilus assembly protein CpaB
MTDNKTTSGTNVARRIRIRAMAFLGLAMIAGVAAVFLVKTYLDRARIAANRPAVELTTVVVAAEDLPIATMLEPKHLLLVKWPAENVPEGVFEDPQYVLGHSLSQEVVAGEPINVHRLVDPERGRGLSALLQPGKRAMAVKVDQVVGVAGFVHPGDLVDVLVTVKPDEETSKALGDAVIPRLSKTVLQNMKVLAVGQHLSTDGRKPIPVPVVTLEVDSLQAERLALASQYGKIQLTMRSRLDTELSTTEGITPYALLTPEESPELLAAQVRKPAPLPLPKVAVEKATKRRSSRRSTSRSSKPKPTPPVVETKRPEAPVVEILRAGKKERQKLRPSADSQ